MVLYKLIKRFIKELFFVTLIILSTHLVVKGQFLEFVDDLPSYNYPLDFSELSKYKRISAKKYNQFFLNNDNEFFYGIHGKKLNDGISGEREDIVVLNSLDDDFKPIDVTHHNYFYLNGLLDLSDNYYTIIVTEETHEFINVGLYNFEKKGEMLSAIRLLEYSKGEEGQIVYTITKSSINEEGQIHQRTEADFIIDRKFKLDSDGHFRVIEEEIKDFD